jgi:hypothetical protein
VNRSIVLPRTKVTRILTASVLVVLLTTLLALLALSGPASAARGAVAAEEKVLTLRSQADHDTLWLVASEGTATAAGQLPGTAEAVAVSPNGSTAAYLPFAGKAQVWIGYGPLAPKTISLEAAGIKTLTGMTWTSETQLLVAGTTKAGNANGFTDRLYTVDVATGAVASFRNLAGTEPSASPDTGKIAYVRFKKLDNGKDPDHIGPRYRESLLLTTLTGSGAGNVMDSREYRLTSDYRAFAAPQIAAGGDWIAYGTTGSDVSVTYTVIYVTATYSFPWFIMPMPTPVAMAWAPASPLLALGGTAVGTVEESPAAAYVCDVAGGDVARTSRELFSNASIQWIMDMDWSDGGKIVADGLGTNGGQGASEEMSVLIMDSSDLSKATDLGEGHLSAWVR